MQLMGWHAEPQLLGRLKVYIVEGCCEAIAIIIGMHMSAVYMQPQGLFVRLLLMPLVVVFIRIVWAMRLVYGYRQVKNADVGTVINSMSSVHTRDCWSCSTATFTCLSCVLMVWYGILFLLVGSSEGRTGDASENASRALLAIMGLGAIANWAFWRDFVRNFKDAPTEPDDLHILYKICNMYWSDMIKLVRYSQRDAVAPAEAKADAAPEPMPLPDACAVCLEDYKPGEVLAQLPCGHIFHPTCANKWLREDWRCPLRCTLKAKTRAWEASSAREAAAHADGEPMDLEAAVDATR